VGEPITPEFNNRLIHQSGQRATSPTWLKAQLTEEELTRLSGAPRIPSADLEPEAKPVSSVKAVSESPNGDDAKPDSDIEPTPGAKIVQEAAKAPEAETVPEEEKVPGAGKAPAAEKAIDTKKGATTLIESDPTSSSRNDALVDEQDTPEQTDESAFKQAPDGVMEDGVGEVGVGEDVVDEDVVDEDVVKEDLVSEDIAHPNEPRASDQAPRLQRDKPSMPVPSASEERLVPTSRLGGSARELLNDDGSLRKP
jgi:hypothetical protein